MINMQTTGDKKQVGKGTYQNNDGLIDITFADDGDETIFAQPLEAGGRDMWWLWSEYEVDVEGPEDADGKPTTVKETRTRELGAFTRWNNGEDFRPYTIPYSSGTGVNQRTNARIVDALPGWIK